MLSNFTLGHMRHVRPWQPIGEIRDLLGCGVTQVAGGWWHQQARVEGGRFVLARTAKNHKKWRFKQRSSRHHLNTIQDVWVWFNSCDAHLADFVCRLPVFWPRLSSITWRLNGPADWRQWSGGGWLWQDEGMLTNMVCYILLPETEAQKLSNSRPVICHFHCTPPKSKKQATRELEVVYVASLKCNISDWRGDTVWRPRWNFKRRRRSCQYLPSLSMVAFVGIPKSECRRKAERIRGDNIGQSISFNICPHLEVMVDRIGRLEGFTSVRWSKSSHAKEKQLFKGAKSSEWGDAFLAAPLWLRNASWALWSMLIHHDSSEINPGSSAEDRVWLCLPGY